MKSTERANEIAQGTVKHIRYKTLTFDQVKKWVGRYNGGVKAGESWNSGERVFAFEDGTVNFKEGGGMIQKPLTDPNDIAKWIEFLDGFSKEWE